MQVKWQQKIDNAPVQDGYSLYHHVILFDKAGKLDYGATRNESQ